MNTCTCGCAWDAEHNYAATLMLSFVVGIFQRFTGDRQKSTKEYLLANRQLSLIPTVFSMFMSGISAILVLGNSAEMYLYGTQQWISWLGTAFAYISTTIICVPLIYPLKITSNYEYHDMRFKSTTVRLSNTILDIVSSVMYMGLAAYSPAIAMEAVTGFPLWASIVCTGGLATIYTTLGGIKAVVWTDFFQGIIFFVGYIVILVLGCIKVGGLNEVWELCKEGGRITFFDMNPDPTQRVTFWTQTIPAITGITWAAQNQAAIQRYIALPTLKDAKKSYLALLIPSFFVVLLANLTGLTVFAYYYKEGCDPLRGGKITSSNQLLPYFVVDALGIPGLTGLFISMLFAGALSSISTSMNGMSAITWKDIIEPRVHGLSESRKALITKILAFLYGLAGIGFAFGFKYLTGHVIQLSSSILGGIGGPMTGVVWLACFFPWAQWKGALAGLFCGLFMTSWINYGQQMFTPWVEHLPTETYNCTFPYNTTAPPMPENPDDVFGLYRVSFSYISFIGWLTTLIVGLSVSFLTGPTKPEDLDTRTVVNFVNHGCCNCIPSSQRNKCDYCGYKGLDTEEKDQNEPPEKQEISRSETKEAEAMDINQIDSHGNKDIEFNKASDGVVNDDGRDNMAFDLQLTDITRF